MMTTEQQAGNIAIATMIGQPHEFNDSRKGKIMLYFKYDGGVPNCEHHELKYHSDWVWLMETVKIIAATPIPKMNGELFKAIAEELHSLNKARIFKAVATYAAWYNENNKPITIEQ